MLSAGMLLNVACILTFKSLTVAVVVAMMAVVAGVVVEAVAAGVSGLLISTGIIFPATVLMLIFIMMAGGKEKERPDRSGQSGSLLLVQSNFCSVEWGCEGFGRGVVGVDVVWSRCFCLCIATQSVKGWVGMLPSYKSESANPCFVCCTKKCSDL